MPGRSILHSCEFSHTPTATSSNDTAAMAAAAGAGTVNMPLTPSAMVEMECPEWAGRTPLIATTARAAASSAEGPARLLRSDHWPNPFSTTKAVP